MAWRPNERGVCPPEAKGKRVNVKLRCGRVESKWPADKDAPGLRGPPMSWKLTDGPADVLFWDLA